MGTMSRHDSAAFFFCRRFAEPYYQRFHSLTKNPVNDLFVVTPPIVDLSQRDIRGADSSTLIVEGDPASRCQVASVEAQSVSATLSCVAPPLAQRVVVLAETGYVEVPRSVRRIYRPPCFLEELSASA